MESDCEVILNHPSPVLGPITGQCCLPAQFMNETPSSVSNLPINTVVKQNSYLGLISEQYFQCSSQSSFRRKCSASLLIQLQKKSSQISYLSNSRIKFSVHFQTPIQFNNKASSSARSPVLSKVCITRVLSNFRTKLPAHFPV